MDGEPGMFTVLPGPPSMEYIMVLVSGVELAGIIPTHITEVPDEL